MKKIISMLLISCMALSVMVGCGSKTDGDTAAQSSTQVNTEPQKVSWWYHFKGVEAEAMEKAIAGFNSSQSNYIVEGFSVPDKQKYIVAMAGNNSPDLITLSNQEIITYQSNGLLENVTEIAKKNNFDLTSIFDEQTIEANSVDGNMYGMPMETVIIQMFYNKDILAEIGETEPPKTMEDLFDMAVKATKLDNDGNIDALGYPLFPLASARQEGIYAFGGRWVDEETGKKVTPNSQGVIDSLKMNVAYREKYGVDKVQKFVATGNTNRYTPQDIFFAGKQLFRFDGSWLSKMIKDNNPNLNYGVALIPGTKANPDLLGTSRFETTGVGIPVVSKNKDGAFALAKYVTTEGVKDICLAKGALPANKTLFEDADLLASNDAFPQFMNALKTGKGIQYPRLADSTKYTALIEAALDTVYNGTKTPEQAMADLQKEASTLE